MGDVFSGWDGSTAQARVLQLELAQRVQLKDGYRKRLRTVAGFDVGFEDGGAITRAAAALLDAATLQPIAMHVARVPTTMPYVPGLLSFRELPALLSALVLLPGEPDLVLVDGQGIAHPRRLGVAAHFGVVTGLPSIGVAKKILVGQGIIPHQTRGAYTALRDGREQIGWLLRSKVNLPPIVVSPGHRVAMASAADLVMRFTTNERLPDPLHLAQRLAARRGLDDAADEA